MKLICEVENCGVELREGTGSHGGPMICDRCRHAGYYARKMGIAWARHRREQLNFYAGRLEYLEPRVLKAINSAKKSVAEAKAKARVALAKPGMKARGAAALN